MDETGGATATPSNIAATFAPAEAHVTVRDLCLSYGAFVVLHGLNFSVRRGEIFIVMGPSGCGKSTLLNAMVGLKEPESGDIFYGGVNFTQASAEERRALLQRVGVLFQSGALWSSMTLAENVGLPLSEFTRLSPGEVREVASAKLALVGLRGFEDYYPAEISGGMRTRAGLARAMALDPEILFFDEPTAALDPISARRLNDLILELRDSLGATFVVVTHDLTTIFRIGTNSVFIDPTTRTVIASGDPKRLRAECQDDRVRLFLGSADAARPGSAHA
ncbi:MAG TPA: ATP-binding cassette domain-containing protein [Candidatus Binataceae bacterium]|jgi:phospholipid/cholesterol/gamma-HCH transport system ATP-binding protein|nr:ATP-binding cassette domain-containing protein [Candidatus Binataceae bacterium]